MVEEMIKLRELLDKNGIPWIDKSTPKRWKLEGFSIDRTHFKFRGYNWSAINGCGTYGEEEGLIELMSDAVNDGEPLGYLTADEIMDMVKGE